MQGHRKKQKQYSKDANVQQTDSSKVEDRRGKSKKQSRAKHTDRPDSDQDEGSTLVE